MIFLAARVALRSSVSREASRASLWTYLTSDDVSSIDFSKIEHECSTGRVAAVCIATPCTTFSIAQSRGGRAIRSKQEPWGKTWFDGCGARHSVRWQPHSVGISPFAQNLCAFQYPLHPTEFRVLLFWAAARASAAFDKARSLHFINARSAQSGANTQSLCSTTVAKLDHDLVGLSKRGGWGPLSRHGSHKAPAW